MKPDLEELAGRVERIHETLANSHPSLKRGQVWCRACGHTTKVNGPGALRYGWPKCCGSTMTIDSPDETRALAHREGGG